MPLVVVLSAFIGVALGLLGGGGSILAVPVLIHVAGLTARGAIATSLLVVAAASLASMTVHARAGRVRYRVGASFGAASMVGAFAGGHLSRLLPETAQLAAFTAVMLTTGAFMLRRRTATPPAARCASAYCGSAIGFGTGVLTGTIGAGGGFIVVPALATLGGLALPEAIATSLLVIGVNSLVGFLAQVSHTTIDARIALAATTATVAGSYAGASLSCRLRAESLRRGFAVLVLAMGAVMAYTELSEWMATRS